MNMQSQKRVSFSVCSSDTSPKPLNGYRLNLELGVNINSLETNVLFGQHR